MLEAVDGTVQRTAIIKRGVEFRLIWKVVRKNERGICFRFLNVSTDSLFFLRLARGSHVQHRRHSSRSNKHNSTSPSSESQNTSSAEAATPLDLAASASELAAANVAALRRRVLGVAAAELRALPPGRVSVKVIVGLHARLFASWSLRGREIELRMPE